MQSLNAEWAPVPGFNNNLEASSDGQIRRNGRILSQSFNGNRSVCYFRFAGKVRSMPVAVAIASAFIRPLTINEKIKWKDGNRHNNDLTNLEIIRTGGSIRRERAASAK